MSGHGGAPRLRKGEIWRPAIRENPRRFPATKIAIATARFREDEDLRGSDEIARALFQGLARRHDVTIVASSANPQDRPWFRPKTRLGPGGLGGNARAILFPESHLMEYSAKGLHLAARPLARGDQYGNPCVETLRVVGTPPCTPSLYRHLRSSDYDAVHVSAFPYSTSFIALEAARRRGIATVFTPFFHFRMPSFARSAVLKKMVLWATALVACTEPEKAALARLGADSNRVFVVPLFISQAGAGAEKFDSETSRAALGLEGRFVVLSHPWVGKGVLVLLDAIEALAARYQDLALLTIGDPDPAYEHRRDLIRRRNAHVIIRDLGWVPSMKKWQAFSACDVFVMVSLADSFGLSYLHAWALGKPIVAAQGTSADGLVREGEDGFLVAHDKPSELVEIVETLRADMNRRDRIGRAGRERVAREFTADRFVRGYERVFDFVAASGRGSMG